MAKLFTSIINTRLLEWDQRYNIITDAQFGFKPGVGTIDAIFVLQNLISRTLKNKKRLYCCFVDYTKAFDLIDRSKLWYKLQMEGFGGKLLRIIKSLYKNVRACVKHKGTFTETFRISAGVLQGEILSPLLFSMYLNDFERYFINSNCTSIELQMINMFLIMYADDTVLLAESPEGLQDMLNTAQIY